MNRLDTYLVEENFAPTREKAKHLIKEGFVYINGKQATKGGIKIKKSTSISVCDKFNYVGRGGYKIEEANNKFKVDFNEKTVLDLGCSVGGFSDYAIKQGAKKVIAVDTADILDDKLKENSKIEYYPETDYNNIILEEFVDIVMIDITFSPLTQILSKCKSMTSLDADILALLKPPFEKETMTAVESEEECEKVLEETIQKIKELGLEIKDTTWLETRGKEKNQQEYFLHIMN